MKKSDIALLYRNVSAVQDGRTLTCDTLKFISKENKLFGIGDINVFDNEYNLTSDSLLLFTEKDSGRAIGNVILNQKGQTIYADKIEYKKEPPRGWNFIHCIWKCCHKRLFKNSKVRNCNLSN